MLDTTTKKRIDDCRDILVGKLPDPKAQIEQITIGLIYKFMDDMDKETIELGGTAKFFSGEYEKYSWANLFDSRVTAINMLALYSEAIMSMDKNPNIPQLFREIFKNAYLPYRDPETLKMFLKTIGEFEYTHSEKLGDAFEYLLSVMGSQGDAGQFRTPRHIIDFLVAVVDPGKTDTILDPACGTAGFLISAFKHIREKNNHDLTPDERRRMIRNFTGYDISPDMVRLSLVNLYLHGFSDPHICEYDTLSSEERWNENYDVILANPPFMSPKGGIRPHKKFSISSNRSEVLFVDYIAEHLNPKGRAGIIVPEGVIFQSGTAYKDLRKMLVENHLYAVVSLPAGVFNPYSGVKTSILLMDRELAKTKDEILFVKIDNDGFSLGAQRNNVKGGQLEEAIGIVKQFRVHSLGESLFAHAVKKSEIAKNGDFNLSGERYKSIEAATSNFPIVLLSELFEIQRGGSPRPIEEYFTEEDNGINWIKIGDAQEGSKYITGTKQKIKPEGIYKTRLVEPGDFILSNSMSFGRPYIMKISGAIHDGWLVFKQKKSNLSKDYIYSILSSDIVKSQFEKQATGGVVNNLNINIVKQVQIPLPPLSIQQEIVSIIEGYQKIIDGAKMVVENYKPRIEIDPEWEMVELGNLCEFIRGPFGGSLKKEIFVEKGIAIYEQSHAIYAQFDNFRYFITEEKFQEMKRFEVFSNDIIMSCSGTMGKVAIVPPDAPKGIINQALLKLSTNEKLLTVFLKIWMESENFQELLQSNVYGAAIVNVASVKILKELKIPLPTIGEQRQIVTRIEEEQQLVDANKRLIDIFEQKIKERIARVWGTY
ncbi:MAG: N-6 DNA methylase [Bacteroidales bacterium]